MTRLGIDPDGVVDAWRARAREIASGGTSGLQGSLPPNEVSRTPAAAHVARLADRAGLFSFHFEQRIHLPLPDAWVPDGDHELTEAPLWEAGVLPESKYQSFRHDLAIASYHPHHRAKWAVHELMHGLVGFGWSPTASGLFHATAGRLAELLPVALWYFFDEAFLVRCEDHQGGGALFRLHCEACERSAAATPDDDEARRHIEDGLRFVDRELAAIARTRRLGRPVPHRWATLDLCSDGLAYASAHGRRLDHPDFARWVRATCVEGGGWSPSLDELEERVVQVLQALLTLQDAPPLAPTPDAGRWRWMLQDIGGRLVQVASLSDPATHRALMEEVDALHDVVRLSTDAQAEVDSMGTAAVVRLSERLAEQGVLADEVFGTGYPLPRLAPALGSIREGLATVTPITVDALGDRIDDAVAAFVADDTLCRRPLGARWTWWLSCHADEALADLARWESSVAALPRGQPPLAAPPADELRRLAPHAVVRTFAHDVLALAERADQGGLAVPSDGPLRLVPVDGAPFIAEATALVLLKDASEELVVLDVDLQAAAALERLGDGAVPELPDDEADELSSFGVIVPVRYREHR